MAINTYQSVITLNVSGLNIQKFKRHGSYFLSILSPYLYVAYNRPILDLKTPADGKWGDREAFIMQMDIKIKPE